MRLGISTASFFNRISTELSFDILRQMHVDTTELYLNTFSEYEKPFIDALLPRKGNIHIHSIHAVSTQFEPELFSANARARADAENIFRKVCYAAFLLGAKFYTFHGPIRLKNQTYLFDFVKLGDRLNQIIEIAQSYGVKLSYENVHWAYGSTPEYFKQILRQCPHLYTTLDVKQAIQAGEDPIKFLQAMEGRISTIHLCDVKKDNFTCMPGAGVVKFEKFFNEMQNRSMNTVMLLECYPKDYKDINELKAAYDYLCSLIIKIRNS